MPSLDAAAPAPAASATLHKLGRLALRHALALILILFLIGLGASNGAFLTLGNFDVILQQVAPASLLAVGATLVILTGGIDLSVGSIVGLAGVTSALLAQDDGAGHAAVAVTAGVLAGGAIGAFNGLLVALARVPPFVATLGSMTIALGIAYVLSGGQPISGLSDQFLAISDKLWGMPVPVLVMIAVVLVAWLALARTRFGMHVYAVGGNPQAARVAGVNLAGMRFVVYTLSGLLAGLAGALLAARATAGIANTGDGYELNAIAAAVIGGISLMGGRGSLLGTVFGFMIIGVLNNGLNIINVSPFYQLVIKGLIIILAVFIDSLVNQKEG